MSFKGFGVSKLSDYTFGSEIGSGGCSNVIICYNKIKKQKFACKISKISIAKTEFKLMKNELLLLSTIKSPYIVKYEDFFIEKDQVYLILVHFIKKIFFFEIFRN